MDSDSSGEDFMPGDCADRRRAKLFKKQQTAAKPSSKLEAENRNIANAPDTKKKRGRPKGSKNKTNETKPCLNSTNLLVPTKPNAGRNKIVLKINVSKGIVCKGNDDSSSSSTQENLSSKIKVASAPVGMSCDKPVHVSQKLVGGNVSALEKLDSLKLMKLPLTESDKCGVPDSDSKPSTTTLSTDIVRHHSSKSSDDSDESSASTVVLHRARKRRKTRAKLSEPTKPLAFDSNSFLPSLTKYGSNTKVAISPNTKSEKLRKRFKSVKKVKLKKHKKRRSSYFTLIPNRLEDNSARSSGSSSSSEDEFAWDRRLVTRDANAVTKQADLPESSPEKNQRRPSHSPCSSPDRFPNLDLNCSSATNPAVKHLWPEISLDRLERVSVKALNATQSLDIKSQVQGFFSWFPPLTSASKPGDKASTEPSQVRFPVVHEANCCKQWQARSIARGKQPAGLGTRKRKGARRGYLTCPCQNGAGPSSASVGSPSALRLSTPLHCTADIGSEVSTSTGRIKKSFTLVISDDSGGEDFVALRQKSPSPDKLIVAAKLPSPGLIRRCSKSSNDSDVEFVPGPPIEEIVVSDDSNDIIFVSETASPKSKVTLAASKPKVEISGDVVEVLSTESTDVVYDFIPTQVTTRVTTLTTNVQNFVQLPTLDTRLSDTKPNVESCTPQQPNPICALPLPENTLANFDTPLESLYPKQSAFSPQPLDFYALLDYAEAMASQSYEPYSPCIPDPPRDDYDRADDIIDNASPERGVPIQELEKEKEDGLVVWECPVCFEPKGEDTLLATTDCTHLFCDPCIRKVAAMYGKCPVCQFPIKDSNIHPFRFHGYKF